MSTQYFSSTLHHLQTPRLASDHGALAGLRRALARWRDWSRAVDEELREQRRLRDISAAYAGLDRHARQDLGIDRRRA